MKIAQYKVYDLSTSKNRLNVKSDMASLNPILMGEGDRGGNIMQ